MASAAPLTKMRGVTVWKPSGIGFTLPFIYLLLFGSTLSILIFEKLAPVSFVLNASKYVKSASQADFTYLRIVLQSPQRQLGMVKACHYPNLLRSKGGASSSRSDGLNLAVGFNPR